MIRVNSKTLENLKKRGDFNASRCFNCGTCTALCPVGLSILPRQIFRYAVLGSEEGLIQQSDAIFSCLLCKMCEENCPEGVNIAGNIRLIRSYLNEKVYRL